MTNQESNAVRMLNTYLGNKGITYRLRQSRFSEQYCDLLLDSRIYHPIAIECKSVKYVRGKKLYFSSHFTTNKHGKHQITRISDFIYISGRQGWLLIEKRKGRGHKNISYALPWVYVEKAFERGDAGLSWGFIRRKGVRFSPKRILKRKINVNKKRIEATKTETKSQKSKSRRSN